MPATGCPPKPSGKKAAQGGAGPRRFAWSNWDNITHAQANYYSGTNYTYDVSPTRGYHPAFANGLDPYTSPVAYFASNGYGLYDMTGNVRQWVWDWYDFSYFMSNVGSDPHGPNNATQRSTRSGNWNQGPATSKVAYRGSLAPASRSNNLRFRCVLPAVQF
jgi:formylglycine-generating enzyme required for sulfatase activity